LFFIFPSEAIIAPLPKPVNASITLDAGGGADHPAVSQIRNRL
jgi:hypothetical protein